MTGRQRFVRTESEGEGRFMFIGEALQYKIQPVFFIHRLSLGVLIVGKKGFRRASFATAILHQ